MQRRSKPEAACVRPAASGRLALGLVISFHWLAAPVHAQIAPPDEKWMAHCVSNLEPEGLPEAVVRKYCSCMAGIGEEADMLARSQTELERAYPPAHLLCHEEARKP